MESLSIGDYLLTLIRFGGLGLLSEKGGDLSKQIHYLMSSFLILSVLIYGIRIMAGDLIGSGKELILTGVMTVLAIGITSPEQYYNLIISPILNTRDNLSVFFVSDESGKMFFEGIGSGFYRMIAHGYALIDSGSVMSGNIAPILAGIVVMLSYGIYYMLIVANLLFCELIITVLFIVGLISIPIGVFRTTRNIFKGWVNSLVKYNLVFVMTAIVASVVNSINEPIISELLIETYQYGEVKEGILNPKFGMVLIMACFGSYLMLKVMELTAEITGGIASDGATGAKSLANTARGALRTINTGYQSGSSAIRALQQKIKQ